MPTAVKISDEKRHKPHISKQQTLNNGVVAIILALKKGNAIEFTEKLRPKIQAYISNREHLSGQFYFLPSAKSGFFHLFRGHDS